MTLLYIQHSTVAAAGAGAAADAQDRGESTYIGDTAHHNALAKLNVT